MFDVICGSDSKNGGWGPESGVKGGEGVAKNRSEWAFTGDMDTCEVN